MRSVLGDDGAYDEAASEAFPAYNKAHMICLDMPRRMGEVSPSDPLRWRFAESVGHLSNQLRCTIG